MKQRVHTLVGALGFLLALSSPNYAQELEFRQVWVAAGGEARLELRADLLPDFGVEVVDDEGVVREVVETRRRLGSDDHLALAAPYGNFERFLSGRLSVDTGWRLRHRGREVRLDGLTLTPAIYRNGHPSLEVRDRAGRHLLTLTHLHIVAEPEGRLLIVHNADIVATSTLGERLGVEALADLPIGRAWLDLGLQVPVGADTSGIGPGCEDRPLWPQEGEQVDVGLIGMGTVAYQGTDPETGGVKVAPSATLKNLSQGDVPWIPKFDTLGPPHEYPFDPPDQHPFLVWNMYRIVDGRIEQLADSGVKHAFLTLNNNCDINCGSGHVLWPGCEDVYSSGTNDSNSNSGPREDIQASEGLFFSTCSFFDPGCTGSQTNNSGTFENRLLVDPDELQTPGADYFFDSWYVIQYDTDIWNSMGYHPITPTPSGSGWTFNPGPFMEGRAIDEWVDPDDPGPGAQHVSVMVPSATPNEPYPDNMPQGHINVLVRVTEPEPGQFRYNYAVQNFDFDRGVDAFRIPIPAGAQVSETFFRDIDDDAANDWTVTVDGGFVSFEATADHPLPWFTLFNFEIVVDVPPADSLVTLDLGGDAVFPSIDAAILGPEVGGSAPVLTFDPASLDFGDVEVGTTSPPQTATLSNSGDADATGLTFDGLPDGGFAADTADCGTTLPADGSCEVSVTFTPPALGAASATLNVGSDEGATADLDLSGNGVEGGGGTFPEIELEEFVSGLTMPVTVAHAGDGTGRLFVVQQTGEIRIVSDGELLPTPFLDLSGLVTCCGERGLLGLAFHPDYASNGFFYVDYTDLAGDTVVARYEVSAGDPNEADPESATTVLTQAQPFSNHNGGNIAFGPDGYLYIGFGDGGSGGDPQDNGQDLETWLGKLLRIDVDGDDFPDDPDRNYAVPPDNPFVGAPGLDEIWAYGVRNPWRFSFDRATGDLWIGDVGQGAWEEIDFQPAASDGGENYGWDVLEGGLQPGTPGPDHPNCFEDDPGGDGSCVDFLTGGSVLPVLEYGHPLGCSVSGGYRYRGQLQPALDGVYLYADFCSGRIWGGLPAGDGTWMSEELLQAPFNVTAFGEDEAGEVYVVEYASAEGASALHRVVVPGAGEPVLAFDPAVLDFGEVLVGTTSPPQTATLHNTGNADATGLAFSILPDAGFEGDTSACGDTLPAGESCAVSVTFSPVVPGPVTATLHVDSTEGATADLGLSGVGVEAEGPVADVSPDSFEFTLDEGEIGTDTLNIGNLGDLDLEWSITTDVPGAATAPSALDHDPALDEPIDLPDFDLDSLPNGGEPVSFTMPGGVLTEGDVIGFHFIGTVSGISDSSSFASDMCMVVEAPDGTTYVVGGFSGVSLPGCFNAASEEGNPWDFQGVDSTEDGTYESEHDNVFDPALEDEGDWTFTFVNDWDSAAAAAMSWTDVTVTLHKTGGAPSVCDDVTEVPWLSADPDSGTTEPGATDAVTVTADSTAAGVGTHEAALCVATNDPDAPVVPVPVSLTVLEDGGNPVLSFDPSSLDFGDVDVGTTSSPQTATLHNTGDADATGVVFSGLPDSGFEADTSACDATLPAGGSCAVSVTFTPAVAGPATATLHVDSDEDATADLDLSGNGVGGGGPIADVMCDSLDFEVPPGGSDSSTCNIGNLGDADLDWSIDEAEGDTVTGGVPYAYGLAEVPEFHAPVGYDRASGIRPDTESAPADPVVLPAPQPGVIDELDEGFDDIMQLPGAGWALINNSEPVGPTSWFQGNETIFPAGEGAPDAYIAANFESADDAGDISNWLITPEVTVANGTQMTFWTRTTEQSEEFYDRLEVRLSTAGASTDVGTTAESVGDFTELLLTINPDLGPGEYPEEWTQFVVTVTGIPESTSGRFAFRYWITDSGPDGTNGDYVGIDTVSVAQTGGGACDSPVDIPWLSTDPTSGTTPPGDSVPIAVNVDATGLDKGDYTARLCFNTNDPAAPLVEFPVNLTVATSVGPIADITPESFTFEVPEGGSDSDILNVGNIGDADLTWSIDEAESGLVFVPEGAPYRYGLAGAQEFHAPVGFDRASGILRSRGEAPADPIVLPAPQPVAVGSFTEGFDDITTLPGAGWAMINNSEPVGPSSWFQGNETIFPSHEGAPDAYIAANFESTADAGDISNWLLTPEVTIVNGTEACFWTRTSEQFEEFFDRLEVRMSVAGDSTDVGDTAESVGDFTDLLLSINPDLMPDEYPEEWTEFCVTVRERSREPVTGRFAFRYWVTDSGPNGTNGDYIGIDTVSVTQPDDPPPGDCDNPMDIPWLSADPTSGTTAPDASEPVTVTVDATDLEIGEHAAQLCVTTNDPSALLVEVPVNLTVTGTGTGTELNSRASP